MSNTLNNIMEALAATNIKQWMDKIDPHPDCPDFMALCMLIHYLLAGAQKIPLKHCIHGHASNLMMDEAWAFLSDTL